MSGLFFEDFELGATREAGPVTIEEPELLAFARRFDPQPFHLDPDAAARSIYGGVIASGWHTAAIAHRLVVDMIGPDSGSQGSPGADELRWLAPVRAGDALRLRATVIEVRPSQSKPDRGSVRLRYELFNQTGAIVMTMIGIGIFRRRDARAKRE
jgi:acyl dehydratase